MPLDGEYEVIIHSNSTKYGGNRLIRRKKYKAKNEPYSDMDYTIEVSIDANSVIYLMRKPPEKKAAKSASKTAKAAVNTGKKAATTADKK